MHILHNVKVFYNLLLFNSMSCTEKVSSKTYKDIIVCVTIDGDEKVQGDLKEAIPLVFSILKGEGLEGKVTWFLNEHDCKWTKSYQDYLKQIMSRGDEISLHSHVESIIHDYAALYRRIKEDKERLENFCRQNMDSTYEIVSFRSGRMCKSIQLFHVLEALGFKYDCSVRPGWRRVSSGYLVDDRDVPIYQGGYFVKPMVYKVPEKGECQLLEIPTNLYVYHPRLIYKHRQSVQSPLVYVILKHPYEFLGENITLRLIVSIYFKKLIETLRTISGIKFMKIREAGDLLRAYFKNSCYNT